MCRCPLQLVALASLAALPLACDGGGGAAPGGGGDSAAARARVEASNVAAIVDGDIPVNPSINVVTDDALIFFGWLQGTKRRCGRQWLHG